MCYFPCLDVDRRLDVGLGLLLGVDLRRVLVVLLLDVRRSVALLPYL